MNNACEKVRYAINPGRLRKTFLQVAFSEVSAAAGNYAALCLEAGGPGSNAL